MIRSEVIAFVRLGRARANSDSDANQKALTFGNRLGVRLAEKELLRDALDRVQKTGVHLVDAYLVADAIQSKLPVASFN